MTQEEIIAELQSLVRQSNDSALLNQTVHDTFKPLFDEAFDDGKYHNGKTRGRVLELYNNVFDSERQAKNMRQDARLFQEAIDLINRLDEEILHITQSQ